MMDIKFRTLYRNIKTLEAQYFYYGIGGITVLGYVKISEDEQFTGLHDTNGKEIYVGDIVKIPDDWNKYGTNAGEVYEIYFAFGGFRYKPKYKSQSKGYWFEDDKAVEIIGNIHENPELTEVVK